MVLTGSKWALGPKKPIWHVWYYFFKYRSRELTRSVLNIIFALLSKIERPGQKAPKKHNSHFAQESHMRPHQRHLFCLTCVHLVSAIDSTPQPPTAAYDHPSSHSRLCFLYFFSFFSHFAKIFHVVPVLIASILLLVVFFFLWFCCCSQVCCCRGVILLHEFMVQMSKFVVCMLFVKWFVKLVVNLF